MPPVVESVFPMYILEKHKKIFMSNMVVLILFNPCPVELEFIFVLKHCRSVGF